MDPNNKIKTYFFLGLSKKFLMFFFSGELSEKKSYQLSKSNFIDVPGKVGNQTISEILKQFLSLEYFCPHFYGLQSIKKNLLKNLYFWQKIFVRKKIIWGVGWVEGPNFK